ncbi:MAG: serine/threonine-protein kinase [Rubripirellula sp.]|nr:serine/threonine-protein kinase [Rubripirellula sp.]
MMEQSEKRDPVEELGEEFLMRLRRGERPGISDYVNAYPELEDQIRTYFPAMLGLERLKSYDVTPAAAAEVVFDLDPHLQWDDLCIGRELGRGGMGVVYQAEQQSLQRSVAVKVFPAEVANVPERSARFQRESQIAARLHHTNIVPVFSVGKQHGIPYFVMQRIDGLSLAQLIQNTRPSHSVDSPERVVKVTFPEGTESESCLHTGQPINELVQDQFGEKGEWDWVASIGMQVADALAYAHTHGVLHRDIKPGNLLMDPSGVVWVTDFGLASALDSERVEDQGKLMGTLRYMPPEQIRGQHDARSDIYSLGVTLYELLTRCAAFEADSRVDLLNQIMMGESRSPRELRPVVPRDLDAIVMKAMEYRPERRYASAEELLGDLRRFLERRPVRARPTGPLPRITQWARRAPVVASLSGTLFLVCMLALVLVSAKWNEAVGETRRAENNLELALESIDHLLGRFASSWMADSSTFIPGAELSEENIGFPLVVSDHNANVLNSALEFYDRFAQQNPVDRRLQTDMARVHRRVAEIHSRLGQYEPAIEAYLRSLAILDAHADCDMPALALSRARIHNQIGMAMHASSRFDEALYRYSRARTLLSAPALAERKDCRAELARVFTNTGNSQWLMLQREQASKSHQEAISILERLVSEDPSAQDLQLALAKGYRVYYPLVAFSRRRGESERVRDAGLKILEQLVTDFPDHPDYQCELCEMLIVSSRRRRGSRNVNYQIRQLERCVATIRRLTAAYPSIPRYRVVCARALNDMGSALHQGGSLAAGEQAKVDSLEIYRQLIRDFPETPAYRILVAMALRDRANLLERSLEFAAAGNAFEEAISHHKAYMAMRPDNQFGMRLLAGLERDYVESKRKAEQSL